MTLGEKIKTFRNVKGYSQEYMAMSCGISPTAYGKIERNETEVTVSRLKQISELLSVRVEDILQFDEKIAFHNYADSHAHNFGKLGTYNNHAETVEMLKTIYESRIHRLEEEVWKYADCYSSF